MYKLFYRKEVTKSLKKIKRANSSRFMSDFQEILNNISEDPENSGIPLNGNMEGFYKYPYSKNPEYRIIFIIYSMEYIKDNPNKFDDIELSEEDLKIFDGIVDLIFIKTREDCNSLYKQKRKYFESKFR